MPENFNPEQVLSPEEEREYTSRVLLHFARHGQRTKDHGDGSDSVQILTEIGGKQALGKGKGIGKAKPTAMAFGGHKVRSRQMGGFMLAGAEGRSAEEGGDITGNESPEELQAILDQDLKYGTRMATDPRLSFHYDTQVVEDTCDAAYDRGEGLKWHVEQGDNFVSEHGNENDVSYSKASANVAQVIKKYMGIAPKFDRLVSENEKMDKYGDTLERFMGSHANVIDLFLCKLIEKTKGKEERDRLIKMLGNQMFDEAEGFDIEIVMVAGQPEVIVRYERKADKKKDEEDFVFNERVTLEVLDKLIEEGKNKA
jgi:hypothetical protein